MNRVGTASVSILGSLAITTLAAAQAGAPPPPPPLPPPAASPAPAAPAPAPAAPAPAAPPAAGAPPAAPGAAATADVGVSARTDSGLDTWGTAPPTGDRTATSPETNPEELGNEWRRSSLQLQTGITGSTGLLRVTQAGSGAPGTLRLSLMTSIFSGSGVLCGSINPCPSLDGQAVTNSDDLDAMTAHLGISATILPFLEAYLGFHNRATSDSRSRPQLLQVLGDTNLGLKAFMPATPDQLFFVGGEAELWLLNGTGGVGLDGGGTSFALRGLATLDANNRINPDDRIPLRAHLNLAYKFDNSANLVSNLENTDPPVGRGARISRIERFGLGINRVDFFQFGIGGEYVHPVIRPFLEWTLDIPLNRKGYICNIDEAQSHGESCLKLKEGLGVSPSRLTLGAKLFPWEGRGLALLAAFDVGTSGTSTFIDETAPELPWNLWLGVAYAVDTEPPKPTIQRVSVPATTQVGPIEHFISGKVVEKGTQAPVPNALLRYDGRPITGMISDESGSFRSTNLLPGTYTFNVSAAGFKDGQCTVTVTAAPAAPATPAAPGTPGTPALPPQPIAPGETPAGQNQVRVPLVCELESLPKLGSVIGSLIDGETNSPVAGAHVRAEDRKNRVLELPGDSSGAFKVTNIPPGRLRLSIDAPGYFPTTTDLDVRALEDVQARIVLNKRPVRPNVVVQGNEVKLKKQVHFATDSAEILPDSMALLEEIADVLRAHPEISAVEVQGHTDNTGTQPHNLRLSQDRAQAVADTLSRLGVDASRLAAKGYGQEKPILPNTSEPNRARNRRVQLIILKK